MKNVIVGLVAVAGVALMNGAAFAAEPPWSPVEVSVVENGKGGYTFTNDHGLPFYVSGKDKKGEALCDDSCTGLTWLPVWARGRSQPMGDWTIVIRPDTSKQWAYKGVPIYSYNGDPDELEDAVKSGGDWKPLVVQ
jgi:predicted lipoprotein with Yx(FWY)xxD motif